MSGSLVSPGARARVRELAIPIATGIAKAATPVPRNVFGRPDDEITSDFALPGMENRARPRASEPPAGDPPAPATPVPVPTWQPLSDDEATGEALLSSIKRPGSENAPEGEPGGGRPGLN